MVMSAINQSHITQPQQPLPNASGITDAEAGAMLRAFFNLIKLWQLTDSEARTLLGQPSTRTYARWKTHGADTSRISHDMRQRLSMLMGIHKALRYVFRDPKRGDLWIKKPNQAFGGQTALQRLLAGEITDLAVVRFYLDAEIGGW